MKITTPLLRIAIWIAAAAILFFVLAMAVGLYNCEQTAKQMRAAFAVIQIGMTKEQVLKVMGENPPPHESSISFGDKKPAEIKPSEQLAKPCSRGIFIPPSRDGNRVATPCRHGFASCASTTIRYCAPVLLNSVTCEFVFDHNAILTDKRMR